MEPGTKIAVISKSGEGATQASPVEKAKSQPSPAEEKEDVEKKFSKAEAAPAIKDTAPSPPQSTAKKTFSSPSKPMASEPQLPPKERERRVSFRFMLCMIGRTYRFLCTCFLHGI